MRYSHDCGVKRQLSLALHPGALGKGQNVKYHLNSSTKSILKVFIPNIVCVLTNERYKIYQTGFLLCCQCNALEVGLGGCLGAKKEISSVNVFVKLSPS